MGRRSVFVSGAIVLASAVAPGCTSSREGTPVVDTVAVDPGTPIVPDRPVPPSARGDAGPIDAAVPPEEEVVPYVPFDVNHVLSTGQSNSVANDGVPVLSKTQPYANLMFDVGIMTARSCDGDGCRIYDVPSSFVPLVEGDTYFYPVETMSSGLANEVSKITTLPHAMLVSLHGRSGNSYWCLRKNGCDWWPGRGYLVPFEDAMKQVTDAKRIADAAGKSYVVRAVTAIHGEHDHYAYSSGAPHYPLPGTDGTTMVADYADALREWQRDYEAGIKAITGQTIDVPLLVSQYSHWNDTAHTVISFMQLDAHVKSNGKVVVVGPTYALPYDSKCLHFSNHGERWLGEYFAKAYARVVLDGKKWQPLRPLAVTRDGATITVKLHVPVPPIVIDTTRVTDPGDYGFEVVDAAGARLPLASVAIAGPDAVAVTLVTAPASAVRVRYAYTFAGCGGAGAAGTRVARGNVRDSDATPSQYGYDLSNWLVHFDLPVP
jgi:hypothetical protein